MCGKLVDKELGSSSHWITTGVLASCSRRCRLLGVVVLELQRIVLKDPEGGSRLLLHILGRYVHRLVRSLVVCTELRWGAPASRPWNSFPMSVVTT